MEIKEKDKNRIVIEVVRGGRSLILGLVFFTVWVIIAQLIPAILIRVLLSIFGVYQMLAILRMLRAIRIVLDKITQTVTISKPSLFLARRYRVIPFSYVSSVVIDCWLVTSGDSMAEAELKVSLNIGGEKFEIAQTTNNVSMRHLASEISTFTGKELIDNSAKPEISFQRFFHKVKGFFRK